ncbi:hypothetical protein AB0D32_27650 [Micromonospora sp. NPDC048170]|uniref:hypothetical protein n=1 Tax=Micromonospora sp. NPDC048170 TaxID=3154819 RepID=UPI0033E0FA73
MPDTDAAANLLARLVAAVRHRRRAPASALAGIALLALRLDRQPLAAALTRVALGGGPVADDRTAWLLCRLAEYCLSAAPDDRALVAAARRKAVAVLHEQYRFDLAADHVDLINGAGGVGMRLWDVADDALRRAVAPSLAEAANQIARQPTNGLYHGRSGALLLRRMLHTVPTADTASAAPAVADTAGGTTPGPTAARRDTGDAVVVDDLARLTPAALDTGELGIGGVTLCYGLPGMAVALGPDVDPRLAAAVEGTPVAAASLTRLAALVADPDSDETLCHGLAGVGLAMRLAPLWRRIVPDDLRTRLTDRLVAHLDRADDEQVYATFDVPSVHAMLSGPLGVALALAETANPTPPWWGAGLSLGDGTPTVAGGGR